ncbi:MAG: hypothetical protein AAGH15_16365 [Myxococcota bacterium]
MRHAVSLLGQLLGSGTVSAAAIVGTERRVLQSGFDEGVEALRNVAQTARQLFRDTSPPAAYLALSFDEGALAFVPAGEVILVLRPRDDDPSTVVALLRRHAGAIRSVAQSTEMTVAASEPPLASDAPAQPSGTLVDESDVLLAALNMVSGKARSYLGGPVVRNYLKSTRKPLSGDHAALEHVRVDLEGACSLEEPGALTGLAPAVAQWVLGFAARAGRIIPELGATSLEELTFGLRDELAAIGFYGDVAEERRSA